VENTEGQFSILLIEDNDTHAEITEFYIKEACEDAVINRIVDGEKAVEYIRKGEAGPGPLPQLILLDLKMPRFDGHEVLLEIKKNKIFKHIPVVIFTTSNSKSDVRKAFTNHANSFIIKPIEEGKFKEVIRLIINYWKLNETVTR